MLSELRLQKNKDESTIQRMHKEMQTLVAELQARDIELTSMTDSHNKHRDAWVSPYMEPAMM